MKVTPFSFVLDASDSSRRLDDLVMARLPSVFQKQGLAAVASKSKLRRLILDGAVSLAGRPVRVPSIKVKPGTVITVYLDPSRFAVEATPGDQPFECTTSSIIYEDEWLIAVNKPPGLPTEGSFLASRDSLHATVRRFLANRMGGALGNQTASEACEDGLPYLGLHHRLDRDTSGVVLFTKRKEANAAIHKAFRSRKARKVYLALASQPQESSGSGRYPQSEDLSKPDISLRRETAFEVSGYMDRISPKSATAKWGLVQTGGLASSTEFFVEFRSGAGLVLRAEPLSGRTHQIRVHAASVGLPLFGDILYGGPGTFRGIPVGRTMLHAVSLTLPHPVSGQALELKAPIPEDFLQIQRLLQSC